MCFLNQKNAVKYKHYHVEVALGKILMIKKEGLYWKKLGTAV